MIFRRQEEPGTPVYGRPYDEDADPAHDSAHDARAGSEAPDWSGARSEGASGAAADHGPGLDRDTEPGQFGRPQAGHADRLVAGGREPDGTTDGATTDGKTTDDVTERDGTFPDADGVGRREPSVPSPAVTDLPEGEGDFPAGRHVAEDTDTGLFGWDADELRRRWHDVQVAFVDDPRDSVERADAMVDEVVSALSSRRRELMDNWKNTGQGDTERLRLALRDYRSLLERLTGPFHGADRGVK